jgi:hypothetical protein
MFQPCALFWHTLLLRAASEVTAPGAPPLAAVCLLQLPGVCFLTHFCACHLLAQQLLRATRRPSSFPVVAVLTFTTLNNAFPAPNLVCHALLLLHAFIGAQPGRDSAESLCRTALR